MTVRQLYKYTDLAGAKFILRDGTLRFACPAALNDPFDVSIQSTFNYEPWSQESLDKLREAQLKVLFSTESLPPFNSTQRAIQTMAVRKMYLEQTAEERAKIKEKIMGTDVAEIWNIGRLVQSDMAALKEFQDVHSSEGILCFSEKFDSNPMWAYYADQNRGVVIEFGASVEKDSLLKLAEKVQYSEVRPFLYESPHDFLHKALFRDKLEFLSEYFRKMNFTKSLAWQHEAEIRVCFPLGVNIFEGETHYSHRYHDEELKRVYLGCRMSKQVKVEIASLARKRNPDVELFEMHPEAKTYLQRPALFEIGS